MRALRLTDAAEGIGAVFADVETLAAACRFTDCSHRTEPGCAVLEAIETGVLEEGRLVRYRKLAREDARNSATLHDARAQDRALHQMYRKTQSAKYKRRED